MEKQEAAGLAAELQALVETLTSEGKAMNLSLLASLYLPDFDESEIHDVREESAVAFAAADRLNLFERHVGPYQDVLGNAANHCKLLLQDTLFSSNTRYPSANSKRYEFPKANGTIAGPHPDPFVWVGLFHGRQVEVALRDEAPDMHRVEVHAALVRKVSNDATELSVVKLMRNILRYLREEAESLPNALYLLRFCALYGLSGAISDVLAGKYGPSDDLSVDSVLPFMEYDVSEERRHNPPATISLFDIRPFHDLYMPAWAFGAALGYCNVVRHCAKNLKSQTHTSLIMEMKETSEMREADPLPGLALLWAIKANRPAVVSCLVSELGFQFRWLSDEFMYIFPLLFHVDRMEDEVLVWRSPRYKPEFPIVEDQEELKLRAQYYYKEKETMIRTMIEVGLPRELFLPRLNVKVEKEMMAFLDKRGVEGADLSTIQPFIKKLSQLEGTARGRLYDAATEYNSIHGSDDKTFTLLDFYEWAVDLWTNQPTAQAVRSSKFEELDPRWHAYEKNGEDDMFSPWWRDDSAYDEDSD